MPLYSTQATVATADNVAANYATNTWHCLAPDLAELALFHAALTTFYQTMDNSMSNLVRTTNGLMMKSYDLADPKPRAPVYTSSATLAPSGAGLPPEVAIVLSFQAPQSSGIPQARRRNRIYLPFLQAAVNGTDGRPAAGFIISFVGAAAALLAASGPTSADWQWVVNSPTDATFDLVDNGWVDNEWDTQRRRGRIATSRNTF